MVKTAFLISSSVTGQVKSEFIVDITLEQNPWKAFLNFNYVPLELVYARLKSSTTIIVIWASPLCSVLELSTIASILFRATLALYNYENILYFGFPLSTIVFLIFASKTFLHPCMHCTVLFGVVRSDHEKLWLIVLCLVYASKFEFVH